MSSKPFNMLTRRSFLATAGALALAGGATLVGCTDQNESAYSSSSASTGAAASTSTTINTSNTLSKGKILIAVFSWSGNTLAMAERLQELAPEADFFRIETAEPYPEDYEETADLAHEQQQNGVLPEIAATVDNWDSYDTVFLGYPIWWYEIPQALKSFISQYDWSGKTIYPFNSHEGSGDAGGPADIAELATGATVGDNLAIRGGEVANSLDQVDEWYQSLDAD